MSCNPRLTSHELYALKLISKLYANYLKELFIYNVPIFLIQKFDCNHTLKWYDLTEANIINSSTPQKVEERIVR